MYTYERELKYKKLRKYIKKSASAHKLIKRLKKNHAPRFKVKNANYRFLYFSLLAIHSRFFLLLRIYAH